MPAAFSPEWLALREPEDAIARSTRLAQLVSDRLPMDREWRAVDLACGTGSNIRFLQPRLQGRGAWLAVDGDATLLSKIPRDARVVVRHQDLKSLDADLFDGRDLVTASAILDLVSEAWLRTLVQRCAAARATVLFALSYDGRMMFTPAVKGDDEIREFVNAHQRLDKGFGAALGPAASVAAMRALEAEGYYVEMEQTDWSLTADAAELQRQLIHGWGRAAGEMAPERAGAIRLWESERLAHIAARRSRIVVGHEDLAGWP
jgi:hypothetical protein